ncbi:phage/plasmid primase, P4 family [Burkholderia pseudomallei]|uniref:phage/plasmid primase, P4 family n=1 Tax=Burkholderia pseudomallei TaxID=28450 RepID=UPI00294A62B4|nr:phage/plasmid primase, P4 family [Burkholderia pseudomallei]CAJ9609122.1 Phage-plasmid primase P4-like [Burkholderia pseudomallei]
MKPSNTANGAQVQPNGRPPLSRPQPDKAAILEALAAMFDPADVIELRAFHKGKKRTDAGYFDGAHWPDLADAAVCLNRAGAACYVTLNRIDPQLLGRYCNRIERFASTTTSDHDVVQRRWLLLDFDPVRPKDTSSTDEQLKAARVASQTCFEYLSSQGWPQPVRAESGNGMHLLYGLDLPNDEASRDLVKGALSGLAARFDDASVSIDQTVFNAARIVKLYGTVANKGDHAPGTPWRLSGIESAPQHDAELVTAEQLRALHTQAINGHAAGRHTSTNGERAAAHDDAPTFDLDVFLARLGVAYTFDMHEGRERFRLSTCPFNCEHVNGEAAIFRGPDGTLGFKCQHNSCAGKCWRDVRALLDGPRPAPTIEEGKTTDAHDRGKARRRTKRVTPIDLSRPVIENVSDHVPPEIASQVASGGKLTEDAAAVLFAVQWQGRICFNARHGCWYEWTGTHWRKDQRGAVIERVRAKLRELLPDGDVRVHGAKMAHNVAFLAQSDARLLPAGEFDADAWTIGTPAGAINLRDGSLRPARPDDLITRVTGCAPDFDGDCPRWREFLKTCAQGDDELVAFVQKLCGYALTGSTRYEFVFVLYGPGANGKTRLLTAIREILGDYFIALPPETFLQSAHEQHPAGIARLQGARLAAVSELPANRSWNSQRVKDISSGERIAARFMRQDFFEFVPVCKLLFVGNHRPRLQQVDEAERRRFRLIPFLHRVPEDQRDHDLEAKLREEYPAILAWMIEGAKRLHEGGFGAMPKAVREASADYFAESDTLATWADERLTFDRALSVRAGVLHDDYRRWFEDNGHDGRPMSANELKQRLIHDYGARYERDMRGRYFKGVALRFGE